MNVESIVIKSSEAATSYKYEIAGQHSAQSIKASMDHKRE
jgi:hypothetical protein